MKLYEARLKRADWRKSSYCAAGECAEIIRKGGKIIFRSSLAPRTVVTLHTSEGFRALRMGIQAGEFDDLG
ncbi:MAG: DUF397 domain-containing protein [Streptosporangiaceae bacterium]